VTTRPRNWALYAVLSFTIIIFLSAIFVIVSILYGRYWSDTTPPPLLGNKPEIISILTDGQMAPQPFSFVVVGDTRSSVVFEGLCQDTLLDNPPDFGIIVGDFVAYPDLNRHRFFIGEFGEWNMVFPIFLIAGNHDVVTKKETGLDWIRDPVYVRDFERMYGPTNFSFVYRGCLFIGLNDAYRIDYLDYLKETLARRPSNILMTFVFMHIPPVSLSPLVTTTRIEGEEEFKSLMDSYNVDYVFMGHFHSYFRADRKHTKYVVTGGGGSDLRGGGRDFHHALLIMVDPSKDRVDEVIYSIKPVFDPGDNVEIVMISGIYPAFEQRPLAWVAVFSLVMATAAGLITVLLARIIRKRRGLR
jgi:3',5'-cyclic AMP phosphodiesterase CpdA